MLSLQGPVAAPYSSTTSISKVYYRKKLKNKNKTLEKQTTEMEPTPEHSGNAFPDFPEDFGAALPNGTRNVNKGKGTAPRKRRCNTPVITQELRSPRFIGTLDGCKPTVIFAKKATIRNKAKGKGTMPPSRSPG